MRYWPLALGISLALVTACQLPQMESIAPVLDQPGDPALQATRRITGRAHFPERWLQALPSEAKTRATVSLINPSNGQTLSAGRTDTEGAFTLNPEATLNLTPGYYYLEVSKRVNQAAFGSNDVAMRTILQWTTNGWASLTNRTGGVGEIVVNPTTTAVALIDHEDATIGFADLIGTIGAPPGFAAVAPFGMHSAASIAQRVAQVSAMLAANVDPIGDRVAATGNMAPDDLGTDPLVHHDYIKNVNGKNSVFVWVPVFTAYQLIRPGNCGAANSLKPTGYWVKDKPPLGSENLDWAQASFGGFYVGKYEAARADATNASAGIQGTLKVEKNVAPWIGANWDQAIAACQAFDAHAHLLRDDEWTALAVWSMINNLTVYGNNGQTSTGHTNTVPKDFVDPLITFTDDPTSQWATNKIDLALTGSGTRADWTGATNLTTHTGTTAGVYDLNGNLWEWTSSLGGNAATGNYILNDLELPVNVAAGFVQTLSTDPRLRRYGLPGSASALDNGFFGGDKLSKRTDLVVPFVKAVRGGSYGNGTNSGVWTINLTDDRSGAISPARVGFRPALRY